MLNDAVDNSDGKTPLREALAEADANSSADTITFALALKGGVSTLTDQLVVDSDVTIDGDLDDDGTQDITLDANADGDLVIAIENVIGSDFDDRIVAQGISDNRLEGRAGNNRLFDRAGNDTLIGGNGFDTLAGGA